MVLAIHHQTGNSSTTMVKTLHYYLGTEFEYTVYEAEGVGLLMGLHLLKNLNIKLTHSMILGADSQAVLRMLDNQRSRAIYSWLYSQCGRNPSQKQDRLINQVEWEEAIAEGGSWKGRTNSIIDLQVHWVPGHINFAQNKRANEEAKKSMQGDSSDAKSLPAMLWKHSPLSISALQQNHMSKLKKCWERRWKSSPERISSKQLIILSPPTNTYIW